MFCANCGGKLEGDWKKCPYCGCNNETQNDNQSPGADDINVSKRIETPMSSNDSNAENQTLKTDFIIGKTKISGRIILKILAIIALVCFFCPLYMVSCAGQEVVAVSGKEITFGFQWMQEKIDGNIMYGLLAVFPLFSLCASFVNEKKLELQEKQETLKFCSYMGAICSGATVSLIWYITSELSVSAEDVGVEITQCKALYIMKIVSILAVGISGYLAYLVEPRKKNGKILSNKFVIIKCCGKILAGSLICLFISLLLLGKNMQPSTNSDDYIENYSITSKSANDQEKQDFSDMDFGKYIGKQGEQLSEMGFTYDADYEEYEALEGKVFAACDNSGKIEMVTIKAADGKEPVLYGVKIGMTEEEVSGKLKNDYPVMNKSGEELVFANVETGGAVTCEMKNKVVTSLMYVVMSEEELKALSENEIQEQYIFPDSDKKYLSEDEVRSVDAEKQFIGRNEIFARHGYIFDDERLKQHFDGTSWYQGTVTGNQFNMDAVFNDFEKKNVELIKKIEDERKGTNKANSFIGMTGTYISTNDSGDITGKIIVSDITSSTASITLGSLDMSYDLASVQGEIINGNTIQADLYGYIITLTWSDSENMDVSGQGELTGTDSAVIMEITSNQSYIRPLEFNQW